MIDKPEQALDFIQDAARNAGFDLNKSVGILIDVGADKLFDEVSTGLVYNSMCDC